MDNTIVLAVASGKGGVGKTLTSLNVAMSAARSGTRVAVIDADPLSDIMAMLDHPLPTRPLPEELIDPESQAFIVAPRLEVVFPQAKDSSERAGALTAALLSDHRQWLNGRYGMVIVDMPAGVGIEEPFPYLDFVDALLLVTNPEPTAHAAAGTFLKGVGKFWGDRPVYLWHNKYEANPTDDFDPDDVVGNYNKNVEKDQRIPSPRLIPVAFVPPDPALDLTKADPPVLVDMYRSLSGTLEGLSDASLPSLPSTGEPGSRSAALIAYFLRRSRGNVSPAAAVAALEIFLQNERLGDGSMALPNELKLELMRWYETAQESPVRRQVEKAREVVNLYVEELESSTKTFSAPVKAVTRKAVDREMVPLLKTLSCLPNYSPLRRLSGLLLFRYALLKLFANESAVKLISAFLPRRTESGQSVRDRRKQIARLVGRDAAYQGRYIALVKKLYPVVSRQLDHLVNTFGLHDLLFRNDDGSVAKNAYVRLFSETMYEIVNSGLGVVAGFRFRPSSRAFKKGFDTLIGHLEQDAEL